MKTKLAVQTKNIKPQSIETFVNKIICGDALKILKKLPDESIDCVVTSPPYWALRDYDVKGQIGLEPSIEEYLNKLGAVFTEIRRVLKPTGTCWVNFGDTYAHKTKGGQQNKPQNNIFDALSKRATIPKLKLRLNIPAKSLCLIPSRFAVKMVEEGWILRNEIIWHKPNAMPQSIKDRFTVDFEKVFFFVKSRKYHFRQQFEPLKLTPRLSDFMLNPNAKNFLKDDKFIRTTNLKSARRSYERVLRRGRNKRCVWTIGTTNFAEQHYATYPPKLIETPILAGCPEGGIVLDPFAGSGTTAVVAIRLGRKYIGIELNPKYLKIAEHRINSLN
jgi:site-specific DNA-methyltransferase (adenine-specific)